LSKAPLEFKPIHAIWMCSLFKRSKSGKAP
jgi:hypothetical protein